MHQLELDPGHQLTTAGLRRPEAGRLARKRTPSCRRRMFYPLEPFPTVRERPANAHLVVGYLLHCWPLPPGHQARRLHRPWRHRSHLRCRRTPVAVLQPKPCQVAACRRRNKHIYTPKFGNRREGTAMKLLCGYSSGTYGTKSNHVFTILSWRENNLSLDNLPLYHHVVEGLRSMSNEPLYP